ncbi:Rieske 2Fe-2S domain-containing protein [Comamonas sp. NLF-1-9]|uniref:Rieske (2Fe-2S) protein n=1 Tax=Comamonas sp. NLF-1-9 TaxID=2853163 RepID=UPI001C45AB6A|nr:Rieske 2Fe-2S domain-containing protein [Comamonas sp. NLF-1-9]QXL84521.1 Rieske 2Fe-2S domain-containing protein [Comamonas sp. NLF-1-9]
MAPPEPQAQGIYLCDSGALSDGGRGVAFDVVYRGERLRAFAVRWRGQVHAYLNRCSHVRSELDYREGHFFDARGQLLVCATHGAVFEPDTGCCVGGPGRGPLVKVRLSESAGRVYWHTAALLQPPPP